MRTLFILYFFYLMYKTIKNTPINLSEEKYKEFIRKSSDNIKTIMSRFPAEYQDYFMCISMAISVFCMLLHAIICIYVGIMSYFPIVEVLCGLEAVSTIYGALAHCEEAYGVLSGTGKIVYHKFEVRLNLVLSYVCYTLVLVSLFAF